MGRIGSQFKRIMRRTVLIGASAFLVMASSPAYVLADDPSNADGTTDPTTSQVTTDPGSSDPGTTPTTTTTSDPSSSDPSTAPSGPSINTAAPTTPTTDPPVSNCPVVNGTNQPTGASSGTYSFNPATCLWENDYYTWDPITKLYTPKTPLVYTYNSATGKWDSGVWDYYAALGSYQYDPFSVGWPPAGAKTIGGPAGLTISNGGSGSNNSLSVNSLNGVTLTNNNGFGITNNISGLSFSGDVMLANNTTAGSALSGDAMALANVLNMLQSSSGLGTAATFVANINGNVQGDLLIDPSLLQPASSTESLNQTNNINVNDHTNGTITNNINLDATSGNATLDSNTAAGDAKTGNATAMANVINMINSMIAANQSFLGVININGNLNGNILLPAQFLDALIASNAPHTTVSIDQNNTTNANVSNTTNQTINNRIRTDATTGNVNMDANTNSGNGTSGNASTNVTIFDLTGDDIDASNTLLVFVNVLGSWVGLLMNAPAGTTAAAFGGNITRNTTNNINATSTTDETINNNISVGAHSGDATVTRNTTAGNATTGDAHAAVNLANLMNDHWKLSGWFGVLFINVWGNWTGSFGVANPLALAGAGGSGGGSTDPASSRDAPPVFKFEAPYSGSSAPTGGSGSSLAGTTLASKVLGTTTVKPRVPSTTVKQTSHLIPAFVTGIIIIVGVSLLGLERYLTFRERHQQI